MTQTNEITPTSPDKRDELRAKIEARERRIAERTLADQAREAADKATNFVKERPFTVLGGALALGLAIGLATKPGRRAARRAASGAVNAVNTAASGTSKVARKASAKQASRFGSLLADAAIAYGVKLIDDAMNAGRKGQDRIEDVGDAATSKAREVRRDAEYYVGSALDKGLSITRRTRRRAGRAVRDLKGRVAN